MHMVAADGIPLPRHHGLLVTASTFLDAALERAKPSLQGVRGATAHRAPPPIQAAHWPCDSAQDADSTGGVYCLLEFIGLSE